MEKWQTRQSLLMRLRDQFDETAWEEFHESYKPYIYMVIKKMNLSHDDTQELSQVTIFKAWKSLQVYMDSSSGGKFRSWLARVAVNTSLDFIKADKRHQNRIEKYSENEKILNASDEELALIAEKEWQIYLTNLAWERIRGGFTEQVAQCFALSLEGFSPDEIADKIQVSKANFYTYKNRVKKRLVEEINILRKHLE